MKKLKECENQRFRHQQDSINNQRLQILTSQGWKTVPFQLGPDDAVMIYESGALLIRKTKDEMHIMFVDNYNNVLLDHEEVDITDIGVRVKDINAKVYSSGVLFDMEMFSGNHHYYYHTYLGGYYHEQNLYQLMDKVEFYESALRSEYLYGRSNMDGLTKDQPHTKFLFGCLNQDDFDDNCGLNQD